MKIRGYKEIILISAAVVCFLRCGLIPEPKKATLLVPGDYPTIQEAIAATRDGDEVIVSPGIYRENIVFRGRSITLRSTDPEDEEIVESTVIDGDGSGSVITFNNGVSDKALLSGFTITGGNAGTGNGGGIRILNASSPRVKGNIITANRAANGGAVFVNNESKARFENNIFTANTAQRRAGAAIYVTDKSSAEIMDNIFRDHKDGDGVIHIGSTSTDQSSAVISGNVIENNESDFGTGGVVITAHSSADIKDNIIKDNSGSGDEAGGALTVSNNSKATISGNTITNNSARQRGAIVVYRESDATITDNTITGNSAGQKGESFGSGGGITVTYFASATISGNVISENSAGNVNAGGGAIFIDRSKATIDTNTILENTAYRFGGGIYLRGGETEVIIKNNMISGNRAEDHFQSLGGAINVGNISRATIFGNTISENRASTWGGGVYVNDGIAVFGEDDTPWSRVNCPDGEEINNLFSGNTHGSDQHFGADLFFYENR